LLDFFPNIDDLSLGIRVRVPLNDEVSHSFRKLIHRELFVLLRSGAQGAQLGPCGLLRLREADQTPNLQLGALFLRREELLLILAMLVLVGRKSEDNEREVKHTNVAQALAQVVHLAQVDLEGDRIGLVLQAAQLNDHVARRHPVESVGEAFDTRVLYHKDRVLYPCNAVKYENNGETSVKRGRAYLIIER